MGKIKHVCKECGVGFETYYSTSKCCSRRCRGTLETKKALKKRMRHCKICGREYRARARTGSIYCSLACVGKSSKGRTIEERYGRERAVEIRRKMSEKQIGRPPWNKGKTLIEQYGSKRAEEIRAEISAVTRRLPRFKHRCKECGIKYEKPVKESSFCSKSCQCKNKEWIKPFTMSRVGSVSPNRGKSLEELYGKKKAVMIINKRRLSAAGKYTLEKSSNWKGGLSFEPYGTDFSNKLRAEIRERDDFKCVECGWLEKNLKRKLSVHHIDFDKQNNSPDNLVSLCMPCHSQTQFGREEWTEYFQEKMRGD